MKKRKAFITGITGQDGAYLSKFLLEKGYEVNGLVRRTSTPNFWRLQTLGLLDKVRFFSGDVTDGGSLLESISKSKPDEIYNLAAQSFVGSSFDQPINSSLVNGLGTLNILEIVRNIDKSIKVYQASTSELYGSSVSKNLSQNERTSFIPNSPYAAAKLFAFNMIKIYRDSYGIFASNGILFNHESPLRGLEFVTRKITNAAAKIKLGLQNKLELGNLEPKRDWGYAPEYVEAMWKILQHDSPKDFVTATGETHSVKDFVKEAFSIVGLDWKKYVECVDKFKRPKDVNYLKGDYSKIKKELGWEPKISFKGLIKIMIDTDLERWKEYQKGKLFPWDAPSFPENVDYVVRPKEV